MQQIYYYMEILGYAVLDVPASESLIGLYQIDNQLVENSLHRHVDHELVGIVRGSGTVRIGSYEGDFAPGTVAFIKAGTDHSWRSDSENVGVTAVFLHIPKSVFSPSLWKLPETAGSANPLSQKIGQERFAVSSILTGFVRDCEQSKELADFYV